MPTPIPIDPAERAEAEDAAREMLRDLIGTDYSDTTLRVCADKMWSFVGCKKQPCWLWWVEETDTRHVLAFVFGRRRHATLRRLCQLLAKLGPTVAHWFTDAWWA